MYSLENENLETNINNKYIEKNTFKTSKNLFSGNKSVKKGSDCTQKFLSSINTNKDQIGLENKRKSSENNNNWINNYKKIKLENTIVEERKNANEDFGVIGQTNEEKQPITATTKQYDSVPVDFSMYSWARFQTSESLEWCCDQNNVADHSLFYFVTEQTPASSSLDTNTNRIIFENLMHYYSFPETTMNNFYLDLVREKTAIPAEELKNPTDIEIVTSWQEKQQKWKNSITSLFSLFLAQKCLLFYCVFPKFTIMFKAPLVGGVEDYVVVMSTSARRIRNILDSSNIQYKMPFLKKNMKPTIIPDSEDMRALKEMETKIPDQINLIDKSEYSVDYQSESLLVIEGKENIKNYFNFLISFYEGQRKIFLPVIYSRNAFLYSTIQKLQVNMKTMLTNDLKTAYTLKLVGPIFPEIIPALCSLFEKTQNNFFGKFKSNPSTIYFAKAISYILEQYNSKEKEIEKISENENDCLSEKSKNIITNFLMKSVQGILVTNSRIDWENGKYLLNEKREL